MCISAPRPKTTVHCSWKNPLYFTNGTNHIKPEAKLCQFGNCFSCSYRIRALSSIPLNYEIKVTFKFGRQS